MKIGVHVLIALLVPQFWANGLAQDGFRPLFDGKSLQSSGWVIVSSDQSTWSFDEAGTLHCTGKPIGEIRTARQYQNFVLELEWRHMKPRGNAGIFLWADDITARGQPFHRGIEVQILENEYGNTKGHTTHGDIFPIHGAKMVPKNPRGKGSRSFPTESRSHPATQWNHYRITCDRGSVSLEVNGKLVNQGSECTPSKGYLCLESEGGIVEYRNARIKELPDTPVLDEDVAIADRGYRCLYRGIDLAGWSNTTGWTASDWRLINDVNAQALTTRAAFGPDFGFVIDFRWDKDQTGSGARIGLGAGYEIDLTRLALEQAGRWNRLTGEVKGGRLQLQCNHGPSQEEILLDLQAAGPLRLMADGPMQWANIYVRELPKELDR